MNKDIAIIPVVEEPVGLLNQKTELATRAIDLLLFGGNVGQALKPMAAMVGIPAVSVSLILPTKNPTNMRGFLASLSSIINTALDDRVELPEFTGQLAEAIRAIQVIAAEEEK